LTGENSEKFTFAQIPDPLLLPALSPYAQALAGTIKTTAINNILCNFIVTPLVLLLVELTSSLPSDERDALSAISR
jgi:hypothetical protein